MSSSARDLYNAALQAERRGDFQAALKQYKAAARTDPAFRPAFVNLGALYSRSKRPDLAAGFFRRALELGEDAAVHFNLGGESYKLERFEESERHLKSALKLDPRLLKAHVLLGYLYEKQERRDKAEIYFRNALKLAPDNRMANLGYAVSLSEQERYEDALKILEAYVQRLPAGAKNDAFIQNLRAGLLLKLNRHEESLAELQRLSESAPRYTSFTEHLQAARKESDEEYARVFDGIDEKIGARVQSLREKIEKRKALRASGAGKANQPGVSGLEGAEDVHEELQEDLRDLVDLSFLHLFKGDTDKALRYLVQARKTKQSREG